MNDFRIDSFEKVFAASLDEIEEIDKNFPELSDNQRLRAQQLLKNTHDNKAVSYTHLTLPTIYSV